MKRRSSLSLIAFSSIVILFLGFNNCSQVHFDNKNVNLDSLKSQDVFVGNPLTMASKTLLSQVCSVITRCHPELASTDCENGVLATSGIDYQLGLEKSSYPTYSDIVQSELKGTLKANFSATLACATAIVNLSCGISSVQNAYQPSLKNPFEKVALMLPTSPGSCPVVFNQPVSRTEYYVSIDGNDQNDGSKDHPWATITHADKTLVPGTEGAIVHVAPGTYHFTAQTSVPAYLYGSASVVTTQNGTATASITYISDQQWGAKIVAADAVGWYNSGDYVKIIGFEIAGTSGTNFGIYSDGSYGQMVGNHIHHIPVTKNCSVGEAAGGIVFGYYTQSHDNDTIGNLIHEIGPLPGNGLSQSSYCNHAHGIAYRQPRGKIQNNIVYRVNTWGFATWHTATNLQISNNLFFNNGAKGSNGLVGGAISLAAEPNVGLIDDTTVSNNILRNNNGWGLAESSNFGAHNAYINNLVFANSTNLALTTAPIGTLIADPLMVDFKMDGSGNYSLLPSSPAVDAGSLNCAAATGNGNCTPANDFAGFARPYGAALDIGPYESHP